VDDLDGYERVAAQFEEVVVDAYAVNAEHRLPDLRDVPLKVVLRGDVRGLQVRARVRSLALL
jgi:hypothetical protein